MKANNTTPLRYPGGKSILTGFFERFIQFNQIENSIYIEPYCGGAGAAINLLLSNSVSDIYLNDANYSIYAFWKALTEFGDKFIEIFDNIEVSLEEWNRQKSIFKSNTNKSNSSEDIIANGFATFYLNRCNRSGILNAGPIGGNSSSAQNSATYKIDARFSKALLRDKLTKISENRSRIHVYNLDALTFLQTLATDLTLEQQQASVVYLDPPYYKQGSSLYMNHYKHADHRNISLFLKQEFQWRWVLSYDHVKEIKDLYLDFPQYSFYINYSAQESKLGSELLIHCNRSELPHSLVIKEMKQSKKRIELVKIA